VGDGGTFGVGQLDRVRHLVRVRARIRVSSVRVRARVRVGVRARARDRDRARVGARRKVTDAPSPSM
jgi:hypothetical protein